MSALAKPTTSGIDGCVPSSSSEAREASTGMASRELLPWDRRAELGWGKAFWLTCKEVMLRPAATFERMEPEGSVSGSLLFATLCFAVACWPTVGLYFLLDPWPTLELPHWWRDWVDQDVRSLFTYWGLSILVWPVVTLVAAGVDHMLLRMARVRGSFRTTLRGHVLSQAVCLIGLLPFVSQLVLPLWSIGLRIVAYRRLYRLCGSEATLSALMFPVLVLLMPVFWVGFAVLVFLLSPGWDVGGCY